MEKGKRKWGKQEREKEEKWKGNRKGEEGKEGREKGWGSEYASRVTVKTTWICTVSGLTYFNVYVYLFGDPDCSFVWCTSLLSFQSK